MTVRQQFFDLVEREWATLRDRFSVRRIGLFGSCVRDEAADDSDIDVLVELDQKTFDHYMDLLFFLEDNLARKVDLGIAGNLKPALRERVLSEVEYAGRR